MDRLHINFSTGNPQRCSTPECSQQFHSLDPASCRAEYERMMARYTFANTTHSKKTKPSVTDTAAVEDVIQ